MSNKPTAAELEVLKVLWSKGPTTVKEVNEVLNEKRDVGYTTTLKIMQLMHEKGMLSREENGRSHIYTPEIDEKQAQDALVNNLLTTAFEGSAMKLVMQALGNTKTSKEDLEQIKNFINKMEEENK
ncbi:MAG: BlaI/MecI/CopY family transcriptional regulator [Bacteroidales bacterium]|nr:BlaI/MecI/CopY family transcriptional regulator [Bacteroidales bacterium]